MDAAKRLALANLRDVISIADGYLGYGLSRADLIQEGNFGLLRAIQCKRFDPARKLRFITFAQHWVHAAIREFVVRNWRIVKVATTKSQRKLFFKMHRLMAKGPDGKMESPDIIARELNVRPEDVREMRQRITRTDTVALDGDDENPGAAAFIAAPQDETDVEARAVAAFEDNAGKRALREAVAALPERDREILAARRLTEPPETLHHIAERFKISAERVRQVENARWKKSRRSSANDSPPHDPSVRLPRPPRFSPPLILPAPSSAGPAAPRAQRVEHPKPIHRMGGRPPGPARRRRRPQSRHAA